MFETVLLGLVLLSATVPCTWWAVGDLSDPPPARGELNRILRPPDVSLVTGTTVVGVSFAVLVVVGIGSVVGLARKRWNRQSWSVIALPGAAGLVIGYSLRVLTAGIEGAHQGGGLVVVLGVPTVAALLWVAAVTAIRLGRQTA